MDPLVEQDEYGEIVTLLGFGLRPTEFYKPTGLEVADAALRLHNSLGVLGSISSAPDPDPNYNPITDILPTDYAFQGRLMEATSRADFLRIKRNILREQDAAATLEAGGTISGLVASGFAMATDPLSYLWVAAKVVSKLEAARKGVAAGATLAQKAEELGPTAGRFVRGGEFMVTSVAPPELIRAAVDETHSLQDATMGIAAAGLVGGLLPVFGGMVGDVFRLVRGKALTPEAQLELAASVQGRLGAAPGEAQSVGALRDFFRTELAPDSPPAKFAQEFQRTVAELAHLDTAGRDAVLLKRFGVTAKDAPAAMIQMAEDYLQKNYGRSPGSVTRALDFYNSNSVLASAASLKARQAGLMMFWDAAAAKLGGRKGVIADPDALSEITGVQYHTSSVVLRDYEEQFTKWQTGVLGETGKVGQVLRRANLRVPEVGKKQAFDRQVRQYEAALEDQGRAIANGEAYTLPQVAPEVKAAAEVLGAEKQRWAEVLFKEGYLSAEARDAFVANSGFFRRMYDPVALQDPVKVQKFHDLLVEHFTEKQQKSRLRSGMVQHPTTGQWVEWSSLEKGFQSENEVAIAEVRTRLRKITKEIDKAKVDTKEAQAAQLEAAKQMFIDSGVASGTAPEMVLDHEAAKGLFTAEWLERYKTAAGDKAFEKLLREDMEALLKTPAAREGLINEFRSVLMALSGMKDEHRIASILKGAVKIEQRMHLDLDAVEGAAAAGEREWVKDATKLAEQRHAAWEAARDEAIVKATKRGTARQEKFANDAEFRAAVARRLMIKGFVEKARKGWEAEFQASTHDLRMEFRELSQKLEDLTKQHADDMFFGTKSATQIRNEAWQTLENIRSPSGFRVDIRGTEAISSYLTKGAPRPSSLHGRALDIPTSKLLDVGVLRTNVAEEVLGYNTQMARMVSYGKLMDRLGVSAPESGRTSWQELVTQVQEEYRGLAEAAKLEGNSTKATAINAERDKVLRAMRTSKERIFGAPSDALADGMTLKRASYVEAMLQYGAMTSLRGALGSLTDLWTMGLVHTFSGMFKEAYPFFRQAFHFSPKAKTLDDVGAAVLKQEHQLMAVSGDGFLNLHHAHIAMETLDGATGLGHGLADAVINAGSSFYYLTGMTALSSATKHLSHLYTQARILHAAEVLATGGKLAEKEMVEMNALGLSPQTLSAIRGEFVTHGLPARERSGMPLSGWADWTNAEAKEKFATAIRRQAQVDVPTPGGEIPAMATRTPWGRILFQFQSWNMAATTKLVVPAIETRDVAYLARSFPMIMAGAGVYTASEYLHGRDPFEHGAMHVLMRAIDQSGVAGLLTMPATVAVNALGPGFGAPVQRGGSPFPLLSTADKLKDVVSEVSKGVGGGDSHIIQAVGKLVPGNNAFPVIQLMNQE